jgi:Zn ribbon nucleic-acid-binding protein
MRRDEEREIAVDCPSCEARIDVLFSWEEGVIDWDGCPCSLNGFIDEERWVERLGELAAERFDD